MKQVAGKTILITGAANGVGQSLAQQLAAMGCNLALIDLDERALLETEKLLTGKGIKTSIHVADISKIADWEKTLNNFSAVHNDLHILINNAGVSVEAPLIESKVADIDWIIDINLKGAIYATKFFLPYLMKAGEAQIVNVSSAAGLSGFPNKTLYCASKFGLKGFSESLRAELYATNIGVSCVHPGPLATDMLSRSRIYDKAKAEKMRTYLSAKGNPPDEVAAAIIKGIRKNKAEILVSSESSTVWWKKRLIPNLFVDLIGKYQNKLPA
jgi:short-subunit dehydrogenase